MAAIEDFSKYGKPVTFLRHQDGRLDFWIITSELLAPSTLKTKFEIPGYILRYSSHTGLLTFISITDPEKIFQINYQQIPYNTLHIFEKMLFDIVIIAGTPLEDYMRSNLWLM